MLPVAGDSGPFGDLFAAIEFVERERGDMRDIVRVDVSARKQNVRGSLEHFAIGRDFGENLAHVQRLGNPAIDAQLARLRGRVMPRSHENDWDVL